MNATDPEVDGEVGRGGTQRYTRRLSDKVLIAFHQACDQREFEVAEQLLRVLDTTMSRRPLTRGGIQRRATEGLVAAYERLWHLRHPEASRFGDRSAPVGEGSVQMRR
jgi:hypothetical protein